ncbi:E3 ubiquitin-protein ligase makorin [Iris pallida]|uniref:E3 ubiquitin-protein ligase makorin n=1 Tax=Iris pallida TaxID=29817 RepID=A0AAX6HXT6_IRIPA|nr:E3 ubiquitin-protein ligase makorin [Iris pallida]
MARRFQCKFFAHGACLKGEHCEFSHDWKAQANNVCTFYQKGLCSHGSRCRYDHVKVSRHQTPAPGPSSNYRSQLASGSVQVIHPSGVGLSGECKQALSSHTELSFNKAPCPPRNPAWTENYETDTLTCNLSGNYSAFVTLADKPICSFAAAGSCPHGEMCPHIHGDLCSICGKQCLPYRPDEREEHIKM